MYDLVHGTILLIAKRLFDASELKKDDEHQVFTPYAMEHFNKASGLSRKCVHTEYFANVLLKQQLQVNLFCAAINTYILTVATSYCSYHGVHSKEGDLVWTPRVRCRRNRLLAETPMTCSTPTSLRRFCPVPGSMLLCFTG